MRLKELYARLIRLRVVGPLVSFPVRLTKRILGQPVAHTVDRIEMIAAAASGLRTRTDSLDTRLADQDRRIEELTRYCDQLAATVEVLQAQNSSSQTRSQPRR